MTKFAETPPMDRAVNSMDETLNFGKGEKTVSASTCRSECENKLNVCPVNCVAILTRNCRCVLPLPSQLSTVERCVRFVQPSHHQLRVRQPQHEFSVIDGESQIRDLIFAQADGCYVRDCQVDAVDIWEEFNFKLNTYSW